MTKRALLWAAAALFFVWETVAVLLWLRAAGGDVHLALLHAWDALRTDWLVLVVMMDAGLFTICALVWLWLDLNRRGVASRARAMWFGGAVLFGTPVLFGYLAERRDSSRV